MTDDADKVLGKDSIEERVRIAQLNRNRAIETESRWNWYVLTLPLAAIAIMFQIETPESSGERVLLVVSFIVLAVGAACGIISQRHKSEMLYSAAEIDIRTAQLSSDNKEVSAEALMRKFEDANEDREKNVKAMKW